MGERLTGPVEGRHPLDQFPSSIPAWGEEGRWELDARRVEEFIRWFGRWGWRVELVVMMDELWQEGRVEVTWDQKEWRLATIQISPCLEQMWLEALKAVRDDWSRWKDGLMKAEEVRDGD